MLWKKILCIAIFFTYNAVAREPERRQAALLALLEENLRVFVFTSSELGVEIEVAAGQRRHEVLRQGAHLFSGSGVLGLSPERAIKLFVMSGPITLIAHEHSALSMHEDALPFISTMSRRVSYIFQLSPESEQRFREQLANAIIEESIRADFNPREARIDLFPLIAEVVAEEQRGALSFLQRVAGEGEAWEASGDELLIELLEALSGFEQILQEEAALGERADVRATLQSLCETRREWSRLF